MEHQVNLVDTAYESLMEARRLGKDVDVENIRTTLAGMRLCDPKSIISTRTADIALNNKRKQFSKLLPYVISQ